MVGEGGRLILCGGEYDETAFGFVFSGFCRMNHCICASSAAISDNPSFVRQRPHGVLYPHFITLTHGSEIKKSKKSQQQVKNGSQKSSEREEFWAIVLHNTTFTISHSPHNRPCVCDRAALQGWWWAATCAASSSPRALPLHRRCFGALTSLALVANAANVAVPCSRCTTHRGGALLLPSAPDLAWG